MIGLSKPQRGRLQEAGALLGVEAVDRTGLVVTGEGAFVRVFRVSPVNPLLMSGEERERAAASFQRLISQLRAGERIQIVVEGRPVNLTALLDDCRRQVQITAGPPPTREGPPREPLSLSRWRLHAALEESLRLHADSQAAVEVNHYVVVPFLPRQQTARAALAYCRAQTTALGAAGADADRAPARGARAPRPGRCAAFRARGRGDGDRAAGRRPRGVVAVVVL